MTRAKRTKLRRSRSSTSRRAAQPKAVKAADLLRWLDEERVSTEDSFKEYPSGVVRDPYALRCLTMIRELKMIVARGVVNSVLKRKAMRRKAKR